MIQIKPGVNLSGLRPEMIIAVLAANAVYQKHNYPLVLTSVTDGKHGRNSLHYVGLAIDFRTNFINHDNEKVIIKDKIKECLGDQFDVVLEATHIHVEYQPE